MEKEVKEVKKATKKTTTTKKVSTKKAIVEKKEVKPVTKKETKPIEKKETVKKVTAKPKTVKKEERTVEKKPAVKKTPLKKASNKKVAVEKKEVKPVIKKETVKKETQVVETPREIKEEKVVTKNIPEKKISSELLEIRKKRYIIEAIIIAVLTIIILVFLCNKTFLKISYKTDNINVDIPRFSYYLGDKDNKVKFATLRKSDYLEDYYNQYLEGFIFYSCAEGNNTFYYNESTRTLIKEIKVKKKFIIKTIEITYDARTPEEVCGLR